VSFEFPAGDYVAIFPFPLIFAHSSPIPPSATPLPLCHTFKFLLAWKDFEEHRERMPVMCIGECSTRPRI